MASRERHSAAGSPAEIAVTGAGGYPIVLPAIPEQCDLALDMICGLLLIGGGDIEGRHIGRANHSRARFFNPLRDEFELPARLEDEHVALFRNVFLPMVDSVK